jgi:hypothetical protein
MGNPISYPEIKEIIPFSFRNAKPGWIQIMRATSSATLLISLEK